MKSSNKKARATWWAAGEVSYSPVSYVESSVAKNQLNGFANRQRSVCIKASAVSLRPSTSTGRGITLAIVSDGDNSNQHLGQGSGKAFHRGLRHRSDGY
jgi:hypothetical protein